MSESPDRRVIAVTPPESLLGGFQRCRIRDLVQLTVTPPESLLGGFYRCRIRGLERFYNGMNDLPPRRLH